MSQSFKKILFFLLISLSAFPFISAPIALGMGILFAQLIENPFRELSKKSTAKLLQLSIIGLGFGMSLSQVLMSGKQGFLLTLISITLTMVLGVLIGKWLKVDKITSWLVATGTAICGGSAIAAAGPVLKANEKQMTIALGIVFVLNSVALFVFPPIAQYLQLSQEQFGIWSAIAIHDTSSVVASSAAYGDKALQIATTIKLTRALWIIPLVLVMTLLLKSENKKIRFPYFIIFFIAAIVLRYYFPAYESLYDLIVFISKRGLVVALFLIGSGLTRKILKTIGFQSMLQGVLLWLIVSVSVLILVLNGY